MKISQLIEALQQLLIDHGDLDVETADYSDARVHVMPPKIDWAYIQSRRETKPRFGSSFSLDRRGRKVVRI